MNSPMDGMPWRIYTPPPVDTIPLKIRIARQSSLRLKCKIFWIISVKTLNSERAGCFSLSLFCLLGQSVSLLPSYRLCLVDLYRRLDRCHLVREGQRCRRHRSQRQRRQRPDQRLSSQPRSAAVLGAGGPDLPHPRAQQQQRLHLRELGRPLP